MAVTGKCSLFVTKLAALKVDPFQYGIISHKVEKRLGQ